MTQTGDELFIGPLRIETNPLNSVFQTDPFLLILSANLASGWWHVVTATSAIPQDQNLKSHSPGFRLEVNLLQGCSEFQMDKPIRFDEST